MVDMMFLLFGSFASWVRNKPEEQCESTINYRREQYEVTVLEQVPGLMF